VLLFANGTVQLMPPQHVSAISEYDAPETVRGVRDEAVCHHVCC
jgi:hypothetical protein